MTMQENCEQLRKLIAIRYGKRAEFYSFPKTESAQELLEDEMAVVLLRHKGQGFFFVAEQLIVPVFRDGQLDGAVQIAEAGNLSREQIHQVADLVDLLLTQILTLQSEAELLRQTQRQLQLQNRRQEIALEPQSDSGLVH